MKIYKILALGLLVVIAVGYFIFNDNYFNVDIHSHISPSNKASLDMLSLNTNSSVNDKPIQNDIPRSSKVEIGALTTFMNKEDFEKLMEKGQKNGVSYISVESLDSMTKKQVEQALKDLYEKGSISGGIKLKEFTELDKARSILKQEGLHNMLSQLDQFKSTPDSILNDYDMNLTGAQNFGTYDNISGWSGMYKLYENTSQKVEIEQINLIPDKSAQQLIVEALNITLDKDTPAIYEQLKSDSIEKLTFVSDRQYYQINGQNLKPDQIINIANKIINSPIK
jgi:hypothetical protein